MKTNNIFIGPSQSNSCPTLARHRPLALQMSEQKFLNTARLFDCVHMYTVYIGDY